MKDATLGGYLHEHERPPAFRASDGSSYTVEILAEPLEAEEGGGWGAYLFFLRWQGPAAVGHVETDFLARSKDEGPARAAVERLTLHEVKALLDDLVGHDRS